VVLKEKLLKKEKEYEELNKNLELRVAQKTKELKELNKTLELRVREEIAKNEEKQRMMFWQSRNASLGQMLANIAHQWRQPLTELGLAIFGMKKAIENNDSEEASKLYADSKNTIRNMSETIDNFSNFFTPQKQKYYFNVSDSIKEALVLLDKIIKDNDIIINKSLEDLKVHGISNELTQVIINLISNSKDAFVQNNIKERHIDISLICKDELAIIELEDNAGGIKKENIDKIFEPYFTTKHKSTGTGLGLFMSKMICEQGLDASMYAQTYDDKTKFIIKIPLDRDEK
jgi:C4-dicarboxylate-specific signal transduction histidine kinase